MFHVLSHAYPSSLSRCRRLGSPFFVSFERRLKIYANGTGKQEKRQGRIMGKVADARRYRIYIRWPISSPFSFAASTRHLFLLDPLTLGIQICSWRQTCSVYILPEFSGDSSFFPKVSRLRAKFLDPRRIIQFIANLPGAITSTSVG